MVQLKKSSAGTVTGPTDPILPNWDDLINFLNEGNFTPKSVVFIDSNSELTEDSSNFVWDYNNQRLGLGTTLPGYLLDVSGTGRIDTLSSGSATIGGSGIDTPLQITSTDDIAQISIADNDTTGYIVAKDSYLWMGLNSGGSASNIKVDSSGFITVPADPTNSYHVATKSYVDTFAGGADWQNSVIDEIDLTTSEPGSPSDGDRYINTATGTSSGTSQSVTANYIYEWSDDSGDWVETAANEGMATWVEDIDVQKVFNGSTWVTIGSTSTHNNLSGLQGGTTDEYYHLTATIYGYIDQDVSEGADPWFGNIYLEDDLIHYGDTNTLLSFSTDAIDIQAGGLNFIEIIEDDSQDKITINTGSNDIDFIINTANTTLFRTIADQDRIRIVGDTTRASASAAQWRGFHIDSAAATLTGSTNITTSTGFNLIEIDYPTITSTNSITVTNAATMYIANAPQTGGSTTITNAYALWVDSGNSRFDGDVNISGTLTASSITANGIDLDDDEKAKFGTGDDGEIYVSTDDNLYIRNVTSDKDIIFSINDASTQRTVMMLDGSSSIIHMYGTGTGASTGLDMNNTSIVGVNKVQINDNGGTEGFMGPSDAWGLSHPETGSDGYDAVQVTIDDPFQIRSGGNLLFETTTTGVTTIQGNFLPYADNTYDLGSSGAEFKDLYIDGTAYIDTIAATTVSGNLLVQGADPLVKIKTTSGNPSIKWFLSGDYAFELKAGDGEFTFGETDTVVPGVRLQILQTTGHTAPGAANTYDFGTADYEWKDIYLAGTMYFWTDQQEYIYSDGDFLYFGVDGANILTLDGIGQEHKIRGPWSPTVANTYALGSATYEWADVYLGDGAAIYLGNDQDVTLTHQADAGILLNSNRKFYFNTTDNYIYGDGTSVYVYSSGALTATFADGQVVIDDELIVNTGLTALGRGATASQASTDLYVKSATSQNSVVWIDTTSESYDAEIILSEAGTKKWHIYNDGNAGDRFKIESSKGTSIFHMTPSGRSFFNSDKDTPLTVVSTDPYSSIAITDPSDTLYLSTSGTMGYLGFDYTAGGNNIRVNTSGYLGILCNPTSPLRVTGGTFPQVRIESNVDGATTGIRFRDHEGGVGASYDAHADILWDATAADEGTLYIKVPYTTNAISIDHNQKTTFYGDVGIGTNNPQRLLHIYKDAANAIVRLESNSDNALLYMYSNTDGLGGEESGIILGDNNSSIWEIFKNPSNDYTIYDYGDSSYAFKIYNSGGNVEVARHFTPSSDSSFTNGLDAARWSNTYSDEVTTNKVSVQDVSTNSAQFEIEYDEDAEALVFNFVG